MQRPSRGWSQSVDRCTQLLQRRQAEVLNQTAPKRWIQVEFSGDSMSPWLQSGDRLDVLTGNPSRTLEIGDIVLIKDDHELIAHRVIAIAPLQAKGDRSVTVDWGTVDWGDSIGNITTAEQREETILGIVTGRQRGGDYFCWGPKGHPAKVVAAKLSRWSIREDSRRWSQLRRWVALSLQIVVCLAVDQMWRRSPRTRSHIHPQS